MLSSVKFRIDIQGSNFWGRCLGKQSRMPVRKVHQALLATIGQEEKKFLVGTNMPHRTGNDCYIFLETTKKVAASTVENIIRARLPQMNQNNILN